MSLRAAQHFWEPTKADATEWLDEGAVSRKLAPRVPNDVGRYLRCEVLLREEPR